MQGRMLPSHIQLQLSRGYATYILSAQPAEAAAQTSGMARHWCRERG